MLQVSVPYVCNSTGSSTITTAACAVPISVSIPVAAIPAGTELVATVAAPQLQQQLQQCVDDTTTTATTMTLSQHQAQMLFNNTSNNSSCNTVVVQQQQQQ